MERALDKLGQELDQDQRVTRQRCRRLERLTEQIREEGLRGIVLDIIGLGGELTSGLYPGHRAALRSAR
jgi:hypothetical protein